MTSPRKGQNKTNAITRANKGRINLLRREYEKERIEEKSNVMYILMQ